jgi:hypothetical protein
VIERFATQLRGFHVDAQVFFHLGLADVFGEARRTQRQIELTIVVAGHGIFHTNHR